MTAPRTAAMGGLLLIAMLGAGCTYPGHPPSPSVTTGVIVTPAQMMAPMPVRQLGPHSGPMAPSYPMASSPMAPSSMAALTPLGSTPMMAVPMAPGPVATPPVYYQR